MPKTLIKAYFPLLLSLVVAVAAGCDKREKSETIDSENEMTDNHRPSQESLPSKEEVARFFAAPEERAKKWNDPERDEWQRPDEIISALELQPGMVVADVGAGTGYMLSPISRAVGGGGTVIAIDTSSEMIDYITERRAELGPAKIMPRKVGFEDPELERGSVDRVLVLDTWLHIKTKEAYARRIFEGLKAGGKFVVVDYVVESPVGPPKAMRLETAELSAQLEAVGFQVQVIQESLPWHYIVVAEKH